MNLADAAKPDLKGWGTFLNRNVYDGETFGGMTIDDYLQKLKAFDPNARIVSDQGAENGSTKRIEYDVSKLPDFNKQDFMAVETNKGYGDDGNSGWKGEFFPGADKATQHNDTFGNSVDNRYVKESRNWNDVNVWGPLVMSAIIGGAGTGMFGAGAATQGGLSGSQALNLFQGIGGGAMKGDWRSALLSALGGGAQMAGVPSQYISLGRAALGQLGRG